uniref:alanine racemase n=1 Tax=Ndongobacter massiliensis TaxID=1871025 RepID=UPI00093204DC|nr:alanine racemase [Ndongobacter massiliensis]
MSANVLTIDAQALRFNVRAMRARAPEKFCFAVLKANAYGLGAVEVARILAQEMDGICVATPSEGYALRDAGLSHPILVLGYVAAGEVAPMVRLGIRPALFTRDAAQRFSEEAIRQGVICPVHIALDTGHSRIGFVADDPHTPDDIAAIAAMPGLRIEGVFSHFATADEEDATFTEIQTARFARVIDALRARGVDPGIRHLANDAGLLVHAPQTLFDGFRLGIGLYGVYPSDIVAKKTGIQLEPVASWSSVVSHVKTVEAGTTVSYGRLWKAPQRTRIATVQAGYADGLRRAMTGRAEVLIQGVRCPVRGAICMDQLMVEIGNLDVSVGDRVTIFGKDETGAELPVEELALWAGTIPYEILTGLSARLTRVYTHRTEDASDATSFFERGVTPCSGRNLC